MRCRNALTPFVTFKRRKRSAQSGLTLLELVFTLTLIGFLVGSILFLYIIALRGWSNLGHRSSVHEKLHFALERVVREVREANLLSVANHALRFRERVTNNGYIYYLYNASDSWVPSYNQTSYDLYRTSLTEAGIANDLSDDTFTYGNGDVIVTGLIPPASGTTITSSGNYAIVKLVGKEGDDTLTVRENVKPRNL